MTHALAQHAVEIAKPFGFPITNSMVVVWTVAAGIVIFAQLATRRTQRVPDGAQNFVEWLIERLYAFLESVIGPRLAARTFWYFASVFIFILSANWFGLIPGVGSIGWGHVAAGHFVVDRPLLRGAHADVNLTLAMALVFFACWLVWAIQKHRVRGFFIELFGPKGNSTAALKVPLTVVCFAAGCLQLISILFRPVSLRADVRWLVQVPFYFLELLVGLVQALVFMLLTAAFTFLISQPDEGDHGR